MFRVWDLWDRTFGDLGFWLEAESFSLEGRRRWLGKWNLLGAEGGGEDAYSQPSQQF